MLPDNGNDHKFLEILKAIIGPGSEEQTLIDLCSYVARTAQQLPFRERTFVDVNDHSAHIHAGKFVQADVCGGNHEVFNQQYDVATCLDGIEHVQKPDGWIMLNRMEAMSKKQILFTPLDAWMLDPTSTDPEAHKCVWSPEELTGWASVVLPKYHPTLGIGAFFFWKCADIELDFARVAQTLG